MTPDYLKIAGLLALGATGVGLAAAKYAQQKQRAEASAYLSLMEVTPEQVTSQADAKRYYKLASAKYHPDKPTGDGTRMQQINLAWESLQQTSWYHRLHGAR